jgi:hypothetical protein
MQSFTWNGEVMVPAKPKLADKAFVIGQRYWLEEVADRSWISHQHQFAWIEQAWSNLPETMTEMFPTSEHLRKSALVATGWHREMVVEAGNAKAALRVAAYAKARDEFAHVTTRGPTVIVRWARSQRMHGLDRMDKDEFQRSKDDILNWISALVGVTPEQLRGAA